MNNPPAKKTIKGKASVSAEEGDTNPEINRLESMMASMGQPSEADPELQQLGSMLERIVDIQHPSVYSNASRSNLAECVGRSFLLRPPVIPKT
jgi:hypothetical protein